MRYLQCLWALVSVSWVPVCAQWVWFAEESNTRLVLSSVAVGDDEEKDIAVGDFDKDGWEDIVVVRKEPFSVMGPRTDVLLMNESGILTDRTSTLAPEFISTPTDSRDVLVFDLNGDTWPDLVFANTFQQQPSLYINLGNDINGNWQGFENQSAARLPTILPVNQPGGPQFCAVWAGDLNGDTSPDLYFSNYERSAGTSDALLINDGTGNFTDETVARLGNFSNVAFGTSVEFHDVDGDNDLDILKMSTLYEITPFNPRGIFILYNDGTGVFDQFAFTRFPSDDPYMFTAGNLDGDAFLEFYVVNDNNDQVVSISAAQPNGPVTLTNQFVSSPRTGGFGGNVKLGDVDGDGDLDVGLAPIDVDIANCGDPNAKFSLLRNDGNGNLDEPWIAINDRNFHVDTHDFAFIDVNRDGRLDIFMGMCVGWGVYIQQVGLECPGDCSPDLGSGNYGDGVVDMTDLLDAVASWGGAVEPCDLMPDLGGGEVGDGRIDVTDLVAIRNVFGACGN